MFACVSVNVNRKTLLKDKEKGKTIQQVLANANFTACNKDNELSLSLMKSGGADWVRHPQFIRSSGAPASDSKVKVFVSVPVIEDEDDVDDDEADRDFVEVKLTVEKETTVGAFLDMVVKVARKSTSFKLEDTSRCILKILGTNQWLYERDIPLEHFTGVCDVIRAGKDKLRLKIFVMNATNAHQMLHLQYVYLIASCHCLSFISCFSLQPYTCTHI